MDNNNDPEVKLMPQYIDERGDVASTAETEKSETLTPREARQGRLGRPVLYVLVAGIVLAFIVWGGVDMWGEAGDRDAAVTTNASPSDNVVPNQPSGEEAFDNGTTSSIENTAPVDRDPTPQSGTGGDSQRVTPDGTTP